MTGIFFDIDDTLYSRRALLLQAAREIARDSGWDPAAICGEEAAEHLPEGIECLPDMKEGSSQEDRFMETFYRFSDENFPLIMAGEITPWQSNVQRFVNTVRYLGVDAGDEHGVAFANRYTWLQNHMTLTEELQCMMRELSARSGIRLGVITNGASEFQWKKFHMLGLDEYIDKESVFVSGDLGVSKPDPGIFRAAQEGFGLAPENLWIVGDSVRADIAGAKACGWHTLWLRTGRENPEEVETDLMADSVDEMCRMVLNLEAASPHQPM